MRPAIPWTVYGRRPEPGPSPCLPRIFLRETILTASDSQRFNGIGPGLDVEMDTGRFGPLGVRCSWVGAPTRSWAIGRSLLRDLRRPDRER